MKKSIVVIIFVFSVATITYNFESISKNREYRIIRAKGGLRMRSAPNLTGKTIGVIPNSTEVELLGESGNKMTISGTSGRWSKVNWNGKTGWVFGGFLDEVETEAGLSLNEIEGKWINLEKKRNRFYFEKQCDAGIATYTVSLANNTIEAFYGQSADLVKILDVKVIDSNSMEIVVTNQKTLQFKYYKKDQGIALWNGSYYVKESYKNNYDTVIYKPDGLIANDPNYCAGDQYLKDAGLK